MAASLLKDGFPSAHRTTRQRLESNLDLRRLFSAIDGDPALIGARVEAAAASLSFTSSATNGNVKTLAVGIYEEVRQ